MCACGVAALCLPQWKERGTGDLRFLKDRNSQRVRIVLRQDKTRKVRVNHNLSEHLELRPHPSSEKSWLYSVVGACS